MLKSLAALSLALVLSACGSGGGGGPAHAPAVGRDVHGSVTTAANPVTGGDRSGSDEGGPNGPPAAIVPDVRGMVFADAVRSLWRAGIGYRLVYARDSARRLWSVIEQNPRPGSDTPSSGEINLTLSLHHEGGPTVNGTVRCKPEQDELDDPYCLGKLLKYS